MWLCEESVAASTEDLLYTLDVGIGVHVYDRGEHM